MSKWKPASAEELAARGIVPEQAEPAEQQEAKKPKRKSKAKE
jgi:hypothetical protein